MAHFLSGVPAAPQTPTGAGHRLCCQVMYLPQTAQRSSSALFCPSPTLPRLKIPHRLALCSQALSSAASRRRWPTTQVGSQHLLLCQYGTTTTGMTSTKTVAGATSTNLCTFCSGTTSNASGATPEVTQVVTTREVKPSAPPSNAPESVKPSGLASSNTSASISSASGSVRHSALRRVNSSTTGSSSSSMTGNGILTRTSTARASTTKQASLASPTQSNPIFSSSAGLLSIPSTGGPTSSPPNGLNPTSSGSSTSTRPSPSFLAKTSSTTSSGQSAAATSSIGPDPTSTASEPSPQPSASSSAGQSSSFGTAGATASSVEGPSGSNGL
ncbi:hypothetical protein PSPO01_03687 [Paraphaeosphaeria sporulosa]